MMVVPPGGLPTTPKLSLNVINLLDARTPSNLQSFDSSDPDNLLATFIQPRTVTLGLDMSF